MPDTTRTSVQASPKLYAPSKEQTILYHPPYLVERYIIATKSKIRDIMVQPVLDINRKRHGKGKAERIKAMNRKKRPRCDRLKAFGDMLQ